MLNFKYFLPLILILNCGTSSTPLPDGGMGGAPNTNYNSSSNTSTSNQASSSNGNVLDGGSNAEGGCSTCFMALHSSDHIAAIQNFCPSDDGGTESFIFWAQYLSCGCAKNGSCSFDCGSTPYCTGLFPVSISWADPTMSCANCLDASPLGCGDEKFFCEHH